MQNFSAPKNMKLSYINEGRSGYVVYKDKEGELRFSFEFGGGDCVAIIYVPAPEYWNQRTSRRAETRDEILTFIAQQALKDQVRNGQYVLSDDSIKLFSK